MINMMKFKLVLTLCILVITGTGFLSSFQEEYSSVYFENLNQSYAEDSGSTLTEAHPSDGRFRFHGYRIDLPPQLSLEGFHDAECEGYSRHLQQTWRISRNVLNASSSARGRGGVTFVTHGTASRLETVALLLAYWPGAVSLALYVPRADLHSTAATVRGFIKDRDNVGLHLVVQDNPLYPANLMREIAVNESSTEFVLLFDLDFIPMEGAEQVLGKYRERMRKNDIYVIPAFGYERKPDDLRALGGKDALLDVMRADSSLIMPFRSTKTTHTPTGFDRWYEATDLFEINYRHTFEPYVMMRKADVIPYPKYFLGRRQNKIVFFNFLHAKHYKFYTVPDVYTLHVYHPKADNSFEYRYCVLRLAVLARRQMHEANVTDALLGHGWDVTEVMDLL